MGLEDPLPRHIGPPVGLLADFHIRAALAAGFLFESGTYQEHKAKYASYEIRVGPFFEVLRFEGSTVSHTPSEVGPDGTIQVTPGSTVLLIAEEVFRIPTDIFAKVTTVGQIFASGLAAENTFADPGYTGPLYVTVSNISTRTLSLRRGDPLGRVEFHRLSTEVETSHPGFRGRRPNFVRATVDTALWQLLRTKPVKELLADLVSKSVDEALQQRFVRSEVLIERAHIEIDTLRLVQGAVRRLRIITASLAGILFLLIIKEFNLLNPLHLPEGAKFFWEVIAAILGGTLYSFIEKRFLMRP